MFPCHNHSTRSMTKYSKDSHTNLVTPCQVKTSNQYGLCISKLLQYIYFCLFFRLELATLQQAKEKQEKLDRWEKWKEKIKDNMGNCRNKLEPVEAKDWPRTRKSLQEDLARVQVHHRSKQLYTKPLGRKTYHNINLC